MTIITPLQDLSQDRFEEPKILKKLALASRKLAELKGVVASIPHQGILITTLGLQEAKDSSAIENIVTTHGQLYQGTLFPETKTNAAEKEVFRYREALGVGYEQVRKSGLITLNHIIKIQETFEANTAGFRKLPGTTLQDPAGNNIYTPPQNTTEIIPLMSDLEQFINDDALFDADPLIKMALIHHQFESIHPFYDGNGRTGRILNVLYLVKNDLLEIPVLYLSRYIVQHKADYYRLLQAVREDDRWEDWVFYMLDAIEITSADAIATIREIKAALFEVKQRIRGKHKFYSQDLINSLFTYPYTRIDYIREALKVSRITATKYLDALADEGILDKHKMGRSNYYINKALYRILSSKHLH